MAFDKPTRNRLAKFVADARVLLAGVPWKTPPVNGELGDQMESIYGISSYGKIAPLEKLGHLDEAGLATAALLRERIEYLEKTHPDDKEGTKAAVARLASEQAFTILNRFAAIRMAEKRGLIVESIAKGYQSAGFRTFAKVAGSAFGETYECYRQYLFCLFGELAIDLGVLFDRRSPLALLFPSKQKLEELLEILNAPDLEALWAEDETIGWIYQYYNDPEERKKMKEESSAPRNTRELAVRNQFFTPRYVVEFLTDNTLGRIWYEMTHGDTTLKEQCRYLVRRPNEIFLQPAETAPEQPKQDNLSQEELLKQPVHIPHRPLKDPRTILMLDPACGSMHFGLYAFDLFEVIYDEAWEMAERIQGEGRSIQELEAAYPQFSSFILHTSSFQSKEEFLRQVPRLIIEHNLHGIDIDPRCAQIAGLSLWLRAQKAWQRLGLKPAERPAIKRSNIVCAEPMPGEKELLREFVEREFPAAERAVCLRLLEAIFDKMQLAGEAGSLLKIEEEIRSAIEDARDAWQKLATKPPELFTTTELHQISTAPELTGLEQAVSSLTTDPRHLTTDFWERIEERIYAALRDYAEQAENGGGFQRRLFAEDAARGFAFIDVCRKRYDVALMNPPFGDSCAGAARKYTTEHYALGSDNLAAMFLARASQWIRYAGFGIGLIADKSLLLRNSYAEFRRIELLDRLKIDFLIDLGWGVLDGAYVETFCAALVRKEDALPQSVFINAREVVSTSEQITPESFWNARRHVLQQELFRNVPNCAVAYDIPATVLKLFGNGAALDPKYAAVRQGIVPGSSFRFYRCSWEVVVGGNFWVPLSNGGAFSPFYRATQLVLNWRNNGYELKNFVDEDGNLLSRPQNLNFFGEQGLTYGKRGEWLNPQLQNSHQAFTDEGQGVFPTSRADAWWLVSLLNSTLYRFAINLYCGQHKHCGYVKMLPIPALTDPVKRELEQCARQAVNVLRALRSSFLEHPHFLSIYTRDQALPNSHNTWSSLLETLERNIESGASLLRKFQDNIDGVVLRACGCEPDIDVIRSATVGMPDAGYFEEVSEYPTSRLFLTCQMQDYVLGCAIGRWDIRYATGEQAAPELPDPFAPLPVCPPGQLQNAQGLPARPEDVPAAYPVRIPWDGILVDDPNHPLDLERRVREVIEIIWSGQEGGPTAEAIEHEACEILGVKSLRDYFRKPTGFFADHLKRYSKSRRQAPIYWPLGTPSGSYTLWIYYHRLTDQTLHTCLADFIDPKIRNIQAELDVLTGSGVGGRRVDDLREFLDELKDLHDEIERVIKLPWKPNLNDGVLITASPLWKLFRFPKWQKGLKASWDKLAKGDYDWAHLAHTIWPQRVEKACEKDRSIAIAHGLEHLCKIEPPKPKKRGKKAVEEEIEEEELEETEED